MINTLRECLVNNVNLFKLNEWNYYVGTKEYRAISEYIRGEFDVFEVYFNCMYDRIINLKKVHPKIGAEFLDVVNKNLKDGKLENVYTKTLNDYLNEIISVLPSAKTADDAKNWWLHAD